MKVGWGGRCGGRFRYRCGVYHYTTREGGRECVSFGPLRIIAIPPLDRLSLSPFLFLSSLSLSFLPPFSTTSELDTLIGPLGTVWTGSFAIAAIGREGNAGACCADGGFFSFLGSLSCLCSDSLLESEVLAGKGRLECLI